MQRHINKHIVANSIRMKRTVVKGTFLIIEGSKDKKIYGQLIDHEACSIEIAWGRQNAIGAISILQSDSFLGVLAIVDADFSNITGKKICDDDIITTDLHDMECMMLNSPAFDRILDEYASEDRLEKIAKRTPLFARDLAIKCAKLGCLRLISEEENLGLDFEEIRFSKFVDTKDLTLNTNQMVIEVLNKSQKHNFNSENLVAQVSGEVNKGHDCWQISCGHDIIEVLSIALRRLLSGKNTKDVASDILERSLRLAYDLSDMKSTNLFQSILDWEKRNPSFQVLDKS